MVDRRFTFLVAVSAVVLALSWSLELYTFSIFGIDLGVLLESILVTSLLIGVDIAIWFRVYRHRQPSGISV
jgi:hypothetical protein